MVLRFPNYRGGPLQRGRLKIGIRPKARFTLRQNAAMQYVYDRLPEGWFLNVDGDEFVYLKDRNLKEEVLRQPEHIRSVMIRPAERVHCADTPNIMQFRMAMPRWCCRGIYGDLGSAMQKRHGLSGHWIGKSVTRTGLAKHTVRQHFLQTPEEAPLTDVILDSQQGAYLLHFLDQGFEAWRSKLDWRLSSRGFRREMTNILEVALNSAEPEVALRDIYTGLFVFDRSKLAKLDRANSRLHVDLGQNDSFAQHFSAELENA